MSSNDESGAESPLLVLAVGLPGSGKSTYFASIGANPVSTDAIRLQLADDATDQTIHGPVYATVRYLVRKRMELKRPVTYIDATNLTRKDRKHFFEWMEEFGGRLKAVYFDTPLEVCLERNRGRARVVPEDVIRQMHEKLAPPTVDEGFESVEIVKP